MVKQAQHLASLVTRVRRKCAADGVSEFEALRAISSKTSWPSFQYWRNRAGDGDEVSWEAMLDRRIPPKRTPVPEVVRACAVTMRRMRPDVRYQEAFDELLAQHGEKGKITASSLCRIWQAAGLIKHVPVVEEEVLEFHGGAGLALIGAASLETGASMALANAILDEDRQTAERQPVRELPAEPAGRDERGRLTAEYNRATQAGVELGAPDARWEPDYQKRQKRDLDRKRVLQERPETLAQKALAIGAMPLLTERRGFDGLDGPQGEWLQLLSGGVPYMPSTLDKFLAQLGMLDVEDGLWAAHGKSSLSHISRWATAAGGPPWLAFVMYVDASQDPHWTHKYALSGKISRAGRVGPCLSRISVNAGPGIPFLMETSPGTVSLKKELPRVLQRVKGIVGREGVLGLTVTDAEMSTTRLLAALAGCPDQGYITVLKGRSFADFQATSDWERYRKRGRIREGTLIIHGGGAPEGGLQLRVVEMRREGRHGQSTHFAASYSCESLSNSDVVDAYLSRWPNQEHLFRNTRNGLGLNRSHGFSGETVRHVALGSKKEKAQNRLKHAQEQEVEARHAVETAQVLVKEASGTDRGSRNQLLRGAKPLLSAATKKVNQAGKACKKLNTTSALIHERDTARENVATALTMNVFFLTEFLLREYFGGIRMELRTFIEHFANLPVTVTTTPTEVTYRVQANPRNAEQTEHMRKACAEVTRRGLMREERRLVFLVVDHERKPVKGLPAQPPALWIPKPVSRWGARASEKESSG